MPVVSFWPMLLAVIVLSCGSAGLAEKASPGTEVVVEVASGEQGRGGTPVFFRLPDGLRKYSAYSLVRIDDGRTINVQRLPSDPPSVAWLIDKTLPAGRTRRYRLAGSATAPRHSSAVTCNNDGEHLLVKVGEKPVLQYNHAVLPAPEGIEEHYMRSGHIHPLFDPDGRMVTDDFPPDHAHQHGIFFAWVNTTFEGRKVDFWNQAGGKGRIGHVSFEGSVDGDVFAQFTAVLGHHDLTAPGGPKRVLDEAWTVRVYNAADRFLVDIQSRQTCATNSPLTINEFHYGGMAFRGSRNWFEREPSDFLTSEGKTRADGNHTQPRWVEAHGRINGKASGVTVMCHPANYEFPQPVRLHPSKPYFCFSPMFNGKFEIAPGEAYVSRYRYAVHAGEPDAETSDHLWHDFAKPPRVRIVKAEDGE